VSDQGCTRDYITFTEGENDEQEICGAEAAGIQLTLNTNNSTVLSAPGNIYCMKNQIQRAITAAECIEGMEFDSEIKLHAFKGITSKCILVMHSRRDHKSGNSKVEILPSGVGRCKWMEDCCASGAIGNNWVSELNVSKIHINQLFILEDVISRILLPRYSLSTHEKCSTQFSTCAFRKYRDMQKFSAESIYYSFIPRDEKSVEHELGKKYYYWDRGFT